MFRAIVFVIVGAIGTLSGSALAAPASDRFDIPYAPSQYFLSDAFLTVTVPKLRTAAEAELNAPSLDGATAQSLRSGLAWIALLQHRPGDALALISAQRQAEVKPQLRAIGNLTADITAAGLAAPPADACQAEAKRAQTILTDKDPAIVHDEVVIRLARYQVASDAYFAGTLAFDVDSIYATRHSIDLVQGMQMVSYRAQAQLLPACREGVSTSLREWLAAPAHQIADIWQTRQPAQTPGEKPVVIAVWDSGIDTTLFPDQMISLSLGRERHAQGTLFDWTMRSTTAPLAPLSRELAPRVAVQMMIDKGLMDLSHGDDTADARLAVLRARTASTSEQGEDAAGEDENFLRSHGTAVASEIADGAPFVRLVNLRLLLSFSHTSVPPVTEPEVDRFVTILRGLPAQLKSRHVRLVNMSWVITEDGIADALLDRSLETDPVEAKRRAQAMYAKIKAALQGVIGACPDILFVAAAGNSNQSDADLGSVPQSLTLPNLLVVGAAGASGHPTSFTTYGKGVKLYARGEAVTVRYPGGQVRTESGTSMAAPLVVRAAAYMLSFAPQLTPAQVVQGLIETGTSEQVDMRLIHPAKALEWSRRKRR